MTASESRIAALREQVAAALAEREGGSTVSLTDPDALGQLEAGVRMVLDECAQLRSAAHGLTRRIADFSEMIAALVGFNFSHRLEISDAGDVLDGFAYSLNMMAEELAENAVSREYVDNIFQSIVEPILVVAPTGHITTVNRAFCRLCEASEEELIGQQLEQLLGQLNLTEVLAQGQLTLEESPLRTSHGALLPVSVAASAMKSKMDEQQGLVFVIRDLREIRRIESERLQLRDAVQRQRILLEELSTPLIPITDEIVVIPLIGTIDSERARQMAESLLHSVASRRARVAIIDVTGVPTLAQAAVSGIITTIRGLGLLGVQVVLTGIRPEVAANLVRLGSDLSSTTTASSLQSGINHAMRYLKTKSAPPPQ